MSFKCNTGSVGSVVSPKPERIGDTAVSVEREAFVGQANAGIGLDPACAGRQQPGEHAQQARFADTVGTGNVHRLARAQ